MFCLLSPSVQIIEKKKNLNGQKLQRQAPIRSVPRASAQLARSAGPCGCEANAQPLQMGQEDQPKGVHHSGALLGWSRQDCHFRWLEERCRLMKFSFFRHRLRDCDDPGEREHHDWGRHQRDSQTAISGIANFSMV